MQDDHPLDLVIRRLDSHCELDEADRAALRSLPFQRRTVARSSYILREGNAPTACAMLLSGYAFRQKLSGDGRRHIVALQIPGDALDMQSLFLKRADHNIQSLTRCELAMVSRADLRRLVTSSATLAAAVMAYNLVEASILREWLLNVGRRVAREKLAHLFCEFAYRANAQGLGAPGTQALPMTQEQMGDALGLTSVHVHRTIKVLAAEGLIRRTGRNKIFPVMAALQPIADFNPLYLHLER